MWQTIRKFGLEHSDLPTMIWNSSVFLRSLTLNIHPEYTKKISNLCYIFTIVIGSCYFYVYLFSGIWFVFWKSVETGDILAAMVIFSLCIGSEISTVKLIYMFIYQATIRDLIAKYLAHDSMAIPNSRFSANSMTVLRQVKKRAMIFWITLISNGVIYVIKPFLMPGRHNLEDTEFLYGLQPMFESPNYEISYFLSFAGVIFAVYVPANISAFYIIVTGYIEAQMTALSQELLLIWGDAQEHYLKYAANMKSDLENVCQKKSNKQRVINEYISMQLDLIIKMHSTNISFLGQIEKVFRNAIVVEFGILTAALIADFLGGIENTYMELPFALMQVTMDCITGQNLIDASLVFEKAAYESKWENFDLSNMKKIKTLLLNSQKQMNLTAGGLMNLSYITLMTVGRMIYSTYTALRTTMHH